MLRLFVYVAAEGDALSGSWAKNEDEVRQKIAEPDYGKASEQAANAFNTNRQYVQDAKRIQEMSANCL